MAGDQDNVKLRVFELWQFEKHLYDRLFRAGMAMFTITVAIVSALAYIGAEIYLDSFLGDRAKLSFDAELAPLVDAARSDAERAALQLSDIRKDVDKARNELEAARKRIGELAQKATRDLNAVIKQLDDTRVNTDAAFDALYLESVPRRTTQLLLQSADQITQERVELAVEALTRIANNSFDSDALNAFSRGMEQLRRDEDRQRTEILRRGQIKVNYYSRVNHQLAADLREEILGLGFITESWNFDVSSKTIDEVTRGLKQEFLISNVNELQSASKIVVLTSPLLKNHTDIVRSVFSRGGHTPAIVPSYSSQPKHRSIGRTGRQSVTHDRLIVVLDFRGFDK